MATKVGMRQSHAAEVDRQEAAPVGNDNRRATRSSYGISQPKKFTNVVDWNSLKPLQKQKEKEKTAKVEEREQELEADSPLSSVGVSEASSSGERKVSKVSSTNGKRRKTEGHLVKEKRRKTEGHLVKEEPKTGRGTKKKSIATVTSVQAQKRSNGKATAPVGIHWHGRGGSQHEGKQKKKQKSGEKAVIDRQTLSSSGIADLYQEFQKIKAQMESFEKLLMVDHLELSSTDDGERSRKASAKKGVPSTDANQHGGEERASNGAADDEESSNDGDVVKGRLSRGVSSDSLPPLETLRKTAALPVRAVKKK